MGGNVLDMDEYWRYGCICQDMREGVGMSGHDFVLLGVWEYDEVTWFGV